MSRKRSIPDIVSAGRSRIVPYYRGENFRMRLARRLSANLEQEANVRRWCGQRGLTLRITNEGHHWQIADGGFLAEWWPSSAKLVIGKKIGRASCRERVEIEGELGTVKNKVLTEA